MGLCLAKFGQTQIGPTFVGITFFESGGKSSFGCDRSKFTGRPVSLLTHTVSVGLLAVGRAKGSFSCLLQFEGYDCVGIETDWEAKVCEEHGCMQDKGLSSKR